MKAAFRKVYCPPEDLSVEDIAKPSPQAEEVLVRVRATTVNRTDCAVLTGKPYIMRLFLGVSKPRNPIPGTDFSGIVEEIGEKVENFKIGDKVWGFGDEGIGSQAEYVCIGERKNIGIMPDRISFEKAVASLEGMHYAYNFLNKVEVLPGQHILINGATGAIGSALLQMLNLKEVRITAVCNTPNIDTIKALGADQIIDYLKEDFTQREESYHHIVDAVGKSTFAKCKPLLLNGGSYTSSELGPNWENLFLAISTSFGAKKKVKFPFPSNVPRSIEYVKNLIEQGKFTPLIDRTYPLTQISDAYSYVASGQKTGNVIISYD